MFRSLAMRVSHRGLLTYLSIFEALVNPALVLPVGGVKVILNAVV